MAGYETIEIEQEGRVRIIRFNRPETLNAFNATMTAEFADAMYEADQDPGVGAIVSTGKGRAYSSGADVGGFESTFTGEGGQRARPAAARLSSGFDHEFLSQSKPVIGAINGVAVGMSMTGPLLFDLLLASTQARFSMRFAAIGLVPELASTWMLPKVVGLHRAKEMMLTGRVSSAEEALELGLVHRLVEPEELIPEAVKLGQEIAANPESTLRIIKQMIWADLRSSGDDGIWRRSSEHFAASRKTAEHREALLAFRQKRPPKFHDAGYMEELGARVEAGTS